ncbi:MAG: antirestriction protein ArdA [Lachnospiraceae bacterium]|nr:antirestriction protein ArdA [Lachnospiraceae bacterium]
MKDFNVFITNLKQYTYGNLCGEWVSLPCTKEQMQEVFKRNEITEESGYFFTDYDLPISEMQRDFGEFQRIDELNYLAARMEYLNDDNYNKFSEIVKSAVDTFNSPADYINLIRNLDSFELIPASNDYDLGMYLVETSIGPSALEQNIPGVTRLGDYLNYEKIGYDASVNMNGMFGENCFVIKNSSYEMSYDGEVPLEYVVQPKENEKGSIKYMNGVYYEYVGRYMDSYDIVNINISKQDAISKAMDTEKDLYLTRYSDGVLKEVQVLVGDKNLYDYPRAIGEKYYEDLPEEMKNRYSMLGRLKSDCDYFLSNGHTYEKHLWAKNVEDQIKEMQKIYDSFAEGDKPEWLTQEDINNYSKDMLAARAHLLNENEMDM